MEVITIESQVFKDLTENINAIAKFVFAQQAKAEKEPVDGWVDNYEVCTFQKISEKTLQRLRSNNEIKYSRIRGKTYYRISEIERLMNENIIRRSESIIKKLSYRFKHIVLLYDTDKTGFDAAIRHEKKLRDLGVKRLVLPLAGTKEEKDISDYFKLGNTRENFNQLFIDVLDFIYSETMSFLKPCEIDYNKRRND